MAGKSIFISTHDGLRLHVCERGVGIAAHVPVVCLPGLTRTVADFESLLPVLAHTRRVIAIDSRGRGQSDYDPNPQNYNLAIELADVLTVLSALAIGPAVFVGSSRGGILTMMLAAADPIAIAGAVLHDIGPVIELEGLERIKGYVGKLPSPRSFAEGAEILRALFGPQFPKLETDDWLAAARRSWKLECGMLFPTYDVRLAEALAKTDSAQPLPALWTEFDALGHVPVLVIRGALSDLLSAATVAEMQARHPGMQLIEVPDQGHVPLLGDDIIQSIIKFVASCDPNELGSCSNQNSVQRT